MSAKTRRMEARLDPETEALIMRAAAMNQESLSAFVVRASRAEAERTLARADLTLMSAAQFDVLVDSLDHADEAAGLAGAARRPRRFVRE